MIMIHSEARNACNTVMLTPIHVPTPNHTNTHLTLLHQIIIIKYTFNIHSFFILLYNGLKKVKNTPTYTRVRACVLWGLRCRILDPTVQPSLQASATSLKTALLVFFFILLHPRFAT